MKKVISITKHVVILSTSIFSQNTIQLQDTVKLKEVIIQEHMRDLNTTKPYIKNNTIVIAKNLIEISMQETIDKANNNARQAFSKVPGLSIWENDGSGVQIGIAARGLSPNRSWEMNTRMNGYDIAADPYGYPEAYFNPPLDAVSKVQFIKGSAALAYGSQFGGLVNYHLKGDNITKKLEIESKQTFGQYNLFSSFNSIGGKINNAQYYTYYNHRQTDTWRENNRLNYDNAYGKVQFHITPQLTIGLEYTYLNYLLQQPGGLTDSLFQLNSRQSIRKRNWMNIQWNQAVNNIEYKINSHNTLNIQTYYVYGQRNSVGYLKPIHLMDVYNTNGYANRQVDRDIYNNIATEIKFTNQTNVLNKKNIVNVGYKFFKGNTNRLQQGTGTKDENYSLFIEKYYSKDFKLNTIANALYVENAFFIMPELKIVPGIRYENIHSGVNGYLNYHNGSSVQLTRIRNVLLYGIGTEWKYLPQHSLILNYTRNFRPVLYAELIPSATTDIIDPELKDINGGVYEMTLIGQLFQGGIYYNLSAFYMEYRDKIGTITKEGKNFRTNIGTAINKGLEVLIDIYLLKSLGIFTKNFDFNLYYSGILQNFKYTEWNNPATIGTYQDLNGKAVEYAPEYIHRTGVKLTSRFIDISYQKQIYGDVFTDAMNTELPNTSATIGKIKGYSVDDINIALRVHRYFTLSFSLNNIFDVKYATRRAGGYPGPGLIPGNGRNWLASMSINL